MSSMLPTRRSANDAMLFATMMSRIAVGRNALSWKIVIAVGPPSRELRGLLYWNWWLYPCMYWAKTLMLSVTS